MIAYYTAGATLRAPFLLTCNGIRLPITQNLYRALQQLRRKEEPKTLWADMICINQSDHKKRSRSFYYATHLLYSNAEFVYSWIGEGDKKTDLAMGWVLALTDSPNFDRVGGEML